MQDDEKEQVNYAVSGLLAPTNNTYNGVTLKYSEPSESRHPTNLDYRIYVFKSSELVETHVLSKQSSYLVGRDERVADIVALHGSVSMQHCAYQYRVVDKKLRLYIIDLDSSNGTTLNKAKIEPSRYYELVHQDIINFGSSTRDYVVIDGNKA